MKEEFLHVHEVGKRKYKQKKKNVFPIIKRADIMCGILSSKLSRLEKAKLSNLYAEITYMEKKDLKYINEIIVSSQDDMDVYKMLKKLKHMEKYQQFN